MHYGSSLPCRTCVRVEMSQLTAGDHYFEACGCIYEVMGLQGQGRLVQPRIGCGQCTCPRLVSWVGANIGVEVDPLRLALALELGRRV